MKSKSEYKAEAGRRCGVLLHISSLPSPYGIGTMGRQAYQFIDFLKESGMAYWQLLPVCPTSYGDSPYQSCCVYAGNPYFIDIDLLCDMGLLNYKDCPDMEEDSKSVDYGKLYKERNKLLKKAADNFISKFINHKAEFKIQKSYKRFCKDNSFWLDSYALFMALKDCNQGRSWYDWEEDYRAFESESVSKFALSNIETIEFHKVIQYLFFRQWYELKDYAQSKNISIIGDLPIYVSLDSVDVWQEPKLFQLAENMLPKEVSGCPPDNFSKEGQLWGNPLYDWEAMEQDNFSWWIRRIEYLCTMYDVLRIDHFRGFESYYAIPYKSGDALRGRWKKGPGMKLFNALYEHSGPKSIIAEDLGFLTEEVKQLLQESGFPGMKIIEMAFDSRDSSAEEYLPHNFVRNCVAYTGTHDNDTLCGWFASALEEDIDYARAYLRIKEDTEIHWDIIAALLATVADTCIIQAQDFLGLGSEARMNTPSTVGINWKWRAGRKAFNKELAQRIRKMLILYKRLN